MAYSKEKQEKLMTALTNIGALAGVNTTGAAGGIKGLDIITEQTKCDKEATQVRDGLFKVAIMGTFSSGKSTIINALIGAKVLPEAAMPCTAILTFIQYGTDESKAEVHMVDTVDEKGKVTPGECIVMDLAEFREKYKYTDEDEKEFNETGTVKRFAEVKYAVMRSSKSLMEEAVSIIDSPGLEDKKIATDLAMNIAEEAQAIIYCLPERGTNKPDRDYIVTHFRNCPNNVFFVINKFDLVPDHERPELMKKIKGDIACVFTDQHGHFNEKLYSERVFPISALWALSAQIGTMYDNLLRRERSLTEVEKKLLDEGSLFRPFENQLEEFLTTDEKCMAQYQKCFAQMASTYREAGRTTLELIQGYESNILDDEKKKTECEALIEDIRMSIEITEKTFDNCSLKIQNKISEVLAACAPAIEKTWDEDMAKIASDLNVGTFEFMLQGLRQINIFASEETKRAQMEKFVSKFVTAITEHFANKVEDYIQTHTPAIEEEVKKSQALLNVSIERTEELLADFSRKITNVGPTVTHTDKSWLQIMISAYLGDYSAVTKGAIDGKSNWIEYLKKTLFNTLWQLILISFIDGGLGVVITLLIEFMQGRANKSESVKQILLKTKEGVIVGIREKLVESRKELNQAIAIKIEKKKEEGTAEMLLRLRDEESKMKEIIAARNDHNFNLEEEKKRFKVILDSIYAQAGDAYIAVFEKDLNINEFNSL